MSEYNVAEIRKKLRDWYGRWDVSMDAEEMSWYPSVICKGWPTIENEDHPVADRGLRGVIAQGLAAFLRQQFPGCAFKMLGKEIDFFGYDKGFWFRMELHCDSETIGLWQAEIWEAGDYTQIADFHYEDPQVFDWITDFVQKYLSPTGEILPVKEITEEMTERELDDALAELRPK